MTRNMMLEELIRKGYVEIEPQTQHYILTGKAIERFGLKDKLRQKNEPENAPQKADDSV